MSALCVDEVALAQTPSPPSSDDNKPAIALPPVTVVATRPRPRAKPRVARPAQPASSQQAPAPAAAPPQVAGGNGAPDVAAGPTAPPQLASQMTISGADLNA